MPTPTRRRVNWSITKSTQWLYEGKLDGYPGTTLTCRAPVEARLIVHREHGLPIGAVEQPIDVVDCGQIDAVEHVIAHRHSDSWRRQRRALIGQPIDRGPNGWVLGQRRTRLSCPMGMTIRFDRLCP
jgi:hypothetical protein